MKQKLDIYIIDDSEVNNYYSEDLLYEFEFTNSVSTFVRAKEGLEALFSIIKEGNKLPDIVFLDIQMPEMDGFEFIAALESKLEASVFTTKVFILIFE